MDEDIEKIIDFNHLYKNQEYSDVEFVLKDRGGNIVEIPAHRFVLMSRSTVFARMLYGDMKEAGSVQIADVSAEAFAEFLQLFYMGKVHFTTENIGDVLKLIVKYNAVKFWPVVGAFMEKTLANTTAYEYYKLALSFKLSAKILNKIEAIISEDVKLVLFDLNGEARSNLSVLATFLKSNELDCNEMDLFSNVIAWAESMKQQRNQIDSLENLKRVLAGLLEHIRFPLMTYDDLMKCLEMCPLPLETIGNLLSALKTKSPLTASKLFNCMPRKYQHRKNVIKFNTRQLHCGRKQSNGIIFMRWTGASTVKYKISLMIYTGQSTNTECKIKTNKRFGIMWPLMPTEKAGFKIIHLPAPVILSPNYNYAISIHLSDPVSSRQKYTHPEPCDQPKDLFFDPTYCSNIVSEIHLKVIN